MPVIHSSLEDSKRAVAAQALASTFEDLCAYDLLIRQLRWSVVGASSLDVSRHAADAIPGVQDLQDALAARLAVLDSPPRWMPSSSPVRVPAAGWLEVSEAAEMLLNAASVCVMRARDRLSAVTTSDPVSAAVLVDALRLLEEHSYRWQAAGITWTARGRHGS